MFTTSVLVCLALATYVSAQEDFVDHGVAAPAAESRGVVCLEDENGRPIVICCSWDQSRRGWVLVIDVDSGKAEQIYYPEGVPNSAPFASLLSENRRFYTFAGKVLLEFDPTAREWLFSGTPAPSESCYTGEALNDGPGGLIYAGSYPNCHLVSFDPTTKEMKDLCQLDPREKYVNHVCADSAGWIYAGIGTARANIVAYNPVTGDVKQIVDEADRKLGSGSVHTGRDGKAYGRIGDKYYRMFEGNGEVITKEEMGAGAPSGGIGWGRRTATFPDGRKLKTLNLPERYLEIESPETGETKRLTFEYESGGAQITSVAAGPNGRIHGSSCHPMHFFTYDPQEDTLEDQGGLVRVGGGNFCAMAAQGQYLFGAAYAGGFFYRYDTTKPWNNETGDDPNPKLVAQWPAEICRPRACLAHPDGEHVIMAGFMGYGRRGGGVGIYNVETEEATLLEHTEVIPDQSTITLKALPNGDLVGGTSVLTPGGGHPTETEGVLYIMDWETKQVVFRAVPVPGAKEVWNVEVGRDGMVYGLASGSQLFVFDTEKREVVHRASLSEYGGLPRHLALLRGQPHTLASPDGTSTAQDEHVYVLLSRAILAIAPRTFEHEKIADAPMGISVGAAIREGRLYFASGSHLWSYDLRLPDRLEYRGTG